ncbi:hypothetical protein HJFPF1_02806 [Paramyrothecium foliicola]|nr:hypothetical protein HJFPF1_02806 [Paramyrothecium foliicola]
MTPGMTHYGGLACKAVLRAEDKDGEGIELGMDGVSARHGRPEARPREQHVQAIKVNKARLEAVKSLSDTGDSSLDTLKANKKIA